MDPRVNIKTNRLKTIVIWRLIILQFKNLHNYHVIVQALNIMYLCQHYENINHENNLQMSHILSYRNKNIACMNSYAQIYKFIEVFIYFNA